MLCGVEEPGSDVWEVNMNLFLFRNFCKQNRTVSVLIWLMMRPKQSLLLCNTDRNQSFYRQISTPQYQVLAILVMSELMMMLVLVVRASSVILPVKYFNFYISCDVSCGQGRWHNVMTGLPSAAWTVWKTLC